MLTSGQVLRRRYRIDEYLGGGGFGRIYKAYDLDCDIPSLQVVAIKELYQRDNTSLHHFEREANLLADLRHESLPTVLNYFIEEGTPYLVMVYIPGEDVGKRLKRQRRFKEDEALSIITPILDALQYLHTRNPPVLHRDIKPENIRITPNGRVYLVDFGLAKISDVNQTMTIGAAVTHGYSPPEQYAGETDIHSDLYALGATLYKMLSGTEKMPNAIERASKDTLIPLDKLNPPVSPAIAAAVNRLLMLRPEHRYQNVLSLRTDLIGQHSWPSSPQLSPSVSPALQNRTLSRVTTFFSQFPPRIILLRSYPETTWHERDA